MDYHWHETLVWLPENQLFINFMYEQTQTTFIRFAIQILVCVAQSLLCLTLTPKSIQFTLNDDLLQYQEWKIHNAQENCSAFSQDCNCGLWVVARIVYLKFTAKQWNCSRLQKRATNLPHTNHKSNARKNQKGQLKNSSVRIFLRYKIFSFTWNWSHWWIK